MNNVNRFFLIVRKIKFLCLVVLSLTVNFNVFSQENNELSSFDDDRDYKTYKAIKIGTQTWMAENLNYATDSGSWCYDENIDNCAIYGRLYDWNTAKKACPSGWHLPSDAEWTTLTSFLGKKSETGGMLKALTEWETPNKGASNSSRFTALPGGYRETTPEFIQEGRKGEWWTSSENSEGDAWIRELTVYSSEINRYFDEKALAFSVRCIKDK